jgi:hypothetical protein
MLGLPPGATLRNAVLAGDGLPPARLELLQFFGVPPVEPRTRTVGLSRITFAVDDVERESRALGGDGGALVAGPAGVELELRQA